ncbi:hypothetical protein DPMN_108873 [Dreissena polymorpha]|uniref:Uncharacterized protein n=1 Tax=Dreissena polymorpha TaxID=45954 RepID=A0A9D4K998_DREPO|nr:hypothetical protein DPMN_108873 [Dreissena polymorpha]
MLLFDVKDLKMNPAPEVQKMCLLVYESFTSRYRKHTRSTSHTLTIYSQRNQSLSIYTEPNMKSSMKEGFCLRRTGRRE